MLNKIDKRAVSTYGDQVEDVLVQDTDEILWNHSYIWSVLETVLRRLIALCHHTWGSVLISGQQGTLTAEPPPPRYWRSAQPADLTPLPFSLHPAKPLISSPSIRENCSLLFSSPEISYLSHLNHGSQPSPPVPPCWTLFQIVIFSNLHDTNFRPNFKFQQLYSCCYF